MKTSILRPGYLVSLKSSVAGGIAYSRTDLDAPEGDQGEAIARWETMRMIADAAEYERATKARSAATNAIRAVCAKTPFGLLCSVSREQDLDNAIAEARAIAQRFNESATHSTIRVDVLKGRIADDDTEAVSAIAGEVKDLLAEMNSAIDRLDPEAIREACSRARQMGQILAPEQNAKVAEAIKEAREAAKAIVKRVEKGGEPAISVLAELDRSSIDAARMAFLDFDTPQAPVALPSVNVQRFDDLTDTNPSTPASDLAYEEKRLEGLDFESEPIAMVATPSSVDSYDLR